jgi:serine/threonine protein kinase
VTAKLELDDTATAIARPDGSAPAGDVLGPGSRLGHFRIERRLGAGGMGEVYLATDLALDRPVALKVLPPATAHEAAYRDRLIREARAQARVVHPNVAHIYFIGEERGRLYFAMEYVVGETLAERVAAGPLAVEDALAAVRGAALGLREAQRSGFLHRDVKPSNLMRDPHGEVKVLDFGLVAAATAPDDDDDDHADGTTAKLGDVTSSAPVAQTSFAGTPLYMAPEQARGEPIDLRADIYALGATLYHLVAGAPPFAADTALQLASLHATALRPTVPRGRAPRAQLSALDTLCSRMMAPRAADRFASYDELLHAIDLASLARARPGGFVARVVAATIDSLVLAVPVLLVIGLALKYLASNSYEVNGSPISLTAIAVANTLALARWGRTPGKALLELEVVSVADGARPTLMQALVRTAAQLGLAIAGSWFAGFGDMLDSHPLHALGDVLMTLGVIAAPLVLLASALFGANRRAPWDRVAGTMVRYRTTRPSR